jgi:hypothetical protein
MTVALDLRRCPRFAVWGRDAWIEWRDRGFAVGAAAELIDISMGGALVLAPIAPPAGRAVTFRVTGLDNRGPIEATVADAGGGPEGYRVNLEFVRPCPVAMLVALIDDPGWLP